MFKAMMGGFAFLMLILVLAGGGIYYMMDTNSEEVRVSRFVEYERCRSIQGQHNCDLYLIGKETFRPGDMTNSEHEGLNRELKRDARDKGLMFNPDVTKDRYMASIQLKDREDIRIEKEAYERWREEQ